MGGCHIRRLLSQGYLNAGWAPVYKIAQLALSDSLKRFVNLSGVDFSLNDIQNTDVRSLLHLHISQDVFRLEKTAHYIENGGFTDRVEALVHCKRCVASHQEMAPRRRY